MKKITIILVRVHKKHLVPSQEQHKKQQMGKVKPFNKENEIFGRPVLIM